MAYQPSGHVARARETLTTFSVICLTERFGTLLKSSVESKGSFFLVGMNFSKKSCGGMRPIILFLMSSDMVAVRVWRVGRSTSEARVLIP